MDSFTVHRIQCLWIPQRNCRCRRRSDVPIPSNMNVCIPYSQTQANLTFTPRPYCTFTSFTRRTVERLPAHNADEFQHIHVHNIEIVVHVQADGKANRTNWKRWCCNALWTLHHINNTCICVCVSVFHTECVNAMNHTLCTVHLGCADVGAINLPKKCVHPHPHPQTQTHSHRAPTSIVCTHFSCSVLAVPCWQLVVIFARIKWAVILC